MSRPTGRWCRRAQRPRHSGDALASIRNAMTMKPSLRKLATHLSTRSFMVGERFTVADIVLYAYVHVAEGEASGLQTTRPSRTGSRASRPSPVFSQWT